MDNRKKAINNLLSSTLQQIVSVVIGLLIPRLVITGYGSETNGLISSVNQLLVYLTLFEAGVGASSLQALYKPAATGDRQAVNEILSATRQYFFRTGVLYFATLVLASLLYPFLIDTTLDYLLICGVVFLSGATKCIYFFIQGKYVVFLLAEGKAYIYTRIVTVITTLVGISKVVLLWSGCNILSVLTASFLINLLSPICICIYIKRKYSWISTKAEPNFQAVSQKNYALIQQITAMIFNNTDVLILTAFCGLKVVSVYALFRMIITQLETLLGILYNAVSFSLGQTYQMDRQKFTRHIDIYETCYSIFSVTLFSVALHLLIPFVRLYTAGVTDINYCDPVLAVLFVAVAVLTAMRSTMHYVISFAGYFKRTTPQAVLEAVINLTLSLIGAYKLGIYGVLLGTVAALLYRTVDVICFSNREMLSRTPWKTFAIHGISLAVMLGMYGIFRRINIPVNSYVSFAVVGLVDAVVTFSMLVLAQCLAFSEFRSTIKAVLGKLKRRK